MLAKAEVLITGKVQGVFFRSYIRSHARLWHLKGWVRNTEAGDVEAVFEGEKDDIMEMIRFCKDGPSGATVDEVRVEWGEGTNSFTGFDIRYE